MTLSKVSKTGLFWQRPDLKNPRKAAPTNPSARQTNEEITSRQWFFSSLLDGAIAPLATLHGGREVTVEGGSSLRAAGQLAREGWR
jgi:hypothetical protein